MNAEVVTIRNGKVTCKGAENTDGGSNIYYFIMSKKLIGLIISCEADLAVPWGPHLASP